MFWFYQSSINSIRQIRQSLKVFVTCSVTHPSTFGMDTKEAMTLKEALLNYKYEAGGHIDLTSMEKKFIRKYKQLPHLWNPNHPDYNNRMKRNAGYDALMPIFRQYMPRATRFHIRQKINILRSCYRKERRKHLDSSSIDPDGNIVYSYVPHNWKYNALRFIDDEKENNEVDVSDIETSPEYEDEQELEYVDTMDTESGNGEPDTKIDFTPIYLEENNDEEQNLNKRKRQRDAYGGFTDHSFESYMEESVLEKEFNAIGANVACKLQRMSLQQRYHAELLINKVLINGLKERLTDETDLSNICHERPEESINYNDISTSKEDDYCINTSSKDAREEYDSSTDKD